MLIDIPKAINFLSCSAILLLISNCSVQQLPPPALSTEKSLTNAVPFNTDTLPTDSINTFSQVTTGQAITQQQEPQSTALIVSENIAPAPIINDVWVRLRNNLSFDLSLDNSAIRKQRNNFIRHPDYFHRVSRHAKRYLFHVATAIETQGVPGELALLPIVESAYDPFAYSHGRASGMWQFIPATGKHLGLQQDWWYDGRRDVVKSTAAAIKYLRYLHNRFDGDWLIALAAYNCGEGNVSKAIRLNRARGKGVDFWSLKLPRETKLYVPKMIALAQILNEPERYGVTFPVIPNKPYFETVDTISQIDLAQASALATINLDELYLLNPGFNQWATHPYGPHQLNVPTDKAARFKAALAALPADQRIRWIRYKIKSGDSLSVLAKRYKTTSKLLIEINALRGSDIRAGSTLLVPVSSKGSEAYVLSAAQRLKSKQRNGFSNRAKTMHTVKSGDSLWELARQYGVGMRKLARWNGLATTDVLKIGQQLVIWSKANNKISNNRQLIRQLSYQVKHGDSLSRIAQKFNLRITDIESWNGINRARYLQPGQSLKLFVNVTQTRL